MEGTLQSPTQLESKEQNISCETTYKPKYNE